MGRTGPGWSVRKNTWFSKDRQPLHSDHKAAINPTSHVNNAIKLTRLTHEEFHRTFTMKDVDGTGVWSPIGEAFLDSRYESSGVASSKLRPQSSSPSSVEKLLLQGKNTQDAVSGYSEIHLPTCVDAIQDCVKSHLKISPECKSRQSHLQNCIKNGDSVP